MQRYVSEPLRLPPSDGVPYSRADLELLGVEKAGPSFVVNVFLANPDASEDTPHLITSGWVGTMPVFAHGDCWGDQGHCDPPRGPSSPFDLRASHPLTPVNLTMEVTLALRFLGPIEEVVVTMLVHEARPDAPQRDTILRFTRLLLVTYDP